MGRDECDYFDELNFRIKRVEDEQRRDSGSMRTHKSEPDLTLGYSVNNVAKSYFASKEAHVSIYV